MPASLFLITLAHGRVGAWDEVAAITLAALTVVLIGFLAVAGRRWFAAEREEVVIHTVGPADPVHEHPSGYHANHSSPAISSKPNL